MVTKDPMVTLGVDLASQPKDTAVCLIRWADKSAQVTKLSSEKDLEDGHGLTQLCGPEYRVNGRRINTIGIDAPFGWPTCFITAVVGFSMSKTWPSDDDQDCECGWHRSSDQFGETRFPHLRYRRTDEVVEREMVAMWAGMREAAGSCAGRRVRPLSVSSDRIAAPAMRAARLLVRASKSETVDRSGKCGRFVEVYPAAALAIWELPSTGYKGTEQRHVSARKKMMEKLEGRTGLSVSRDHRELCWKSDDALDALVAALVARVAGTRRCEPIPKEDRELARREGWIALPKKQSLDQLVKSSTS